VDLATAPILVVDDDIGFTELLKELLSSEGFTIEAVHNGDAGLARALTGHYSMIVLDVMLPGRNGLEVLRALRKEVSTPVLMLTARGHDTDRIQGLESGADDYLPKPFHPRELLARIKAILRRTNPPNAAAADNVIQTGDITLDPRTRTVRVENEIVELTSAEFDLLRALLVAAGQIVTREELFRAVLGREFSVFDRSIDNHVSSLRKKLGSRMKGIERIKSVRGTGYIYTGVEKPAAEPELNQ
jgi:two-component system response regulator CpxR